MARIPIRERDKEEEEEDRERFTSKDLTRRQIILYIFEDLFKGFFILGSLFLDGIIAVYVIQSPLVSDYYGLTLLFKILTFLLISTMIMILTILVYLQRKGYLRLFGMDAIKRRYGKKEDKELP